LKAAILQTRMKRSTRSIEDISVENKKKKTQPFGEDDTTNQPPLDSNEYNETIDPYTQENTNRIDDVNHESSTNKSLFTFVYNSGIEWIGHLFGWNQNKNSVSSSESENYESNRMENEVLTHLETNEYQLHEESSPSLITQSREDIHDHYFIQIDLRYQFRRFATPTVRNTVRTQCSSLVHEHMTVRMRFRLEILTGICVNRSVLVSLHFNAQVFTMLIVISASSRTILTSISW
jgi:hypothetical protein